jgi:thiol-disulfide isomerase/thioredoxin
MSRAAAALILALASAAHGAELRPWTGNAASPELALKDLQGREHRLSDYRGKVVVLNFWATWCEPCREEFPDLVRLGHTYRDRGVRMVLVSGDFDSEREAVNQFLVKQSVDFATYMKSGDDMKFINTLNPKCSGALPATFVYDGRGRLRDFWEGKASYEKMEERLLRVLEARGAADSTEART